MSKDEGWKITQLNTFTAWVNTHLEQINIHVDDLITDFSDGLKLIALVEILAQHRFVRFNKKPTRRNQKLENVTTVISFLEDHEHLKLVNIDSGHIVDGNSKLILGLVWALILHYAISVPMEKEVTDPRVRAQKPTKATPKQRLLAWIDNKTPGITIKNFTTDWNSGVALGALVDNCAPGLCPDWEEWGSRKPIDNVTEAVDLAEKWLDVPPILPPSEIIKPDVDDKSMMTYISQFTKSKLKEGAPLRPKTNPARVKVYGSGIDESGNTLLSKCQFSVDTSEAGNGEVEVLITDPNGNTCQVQCHREAFVSTYSYEPLVEGEHSVSIKFATLHVPSSPYRVVISGAPGDASKVVVKGIGVDKDAKQCVDQPTYFNVLTENAGKGNIDCIITDPTGNRNSVKPEITRMTDESSLVEYTPHEVGVHLISVQFAGQPVPQSPFRVNVQPKFNSKSVTASGRGIQPVGVRVNDFVTFQVDSSNCTVEQPLVVSMQGLNGEVLPVEASKLSANVWECSYVPKQPTTYKLDVMYGDGQILGSPFNVNVKPQKDFPINAFGQGLKSGVVGYPIRFFICDTQKSQNVDVVIHGPSAASVELYAHSDELHGVVYIVEEPGEYAVHVTLDGEDIQDSPFMANVTLPLEGVEIKRLQVTTGRETPTATKEFRVGKPIEFTIDGLVEALPPTLRATSQASLFSVLRADCHDAGGHVVPLTVKEGGPDGPVTYVYTPRVEGIHLVEASLAGIPLENTPLIFNVESQIQPEKVHISGPGLSQSTANQPSHLIIDPKPAFADGKVDPKMPLSVDLTDNLGNVVETKLTPQDDGTIKVEYCPPSKATSLHVTPVLADKPVLAAPLEIPVDAGFDVSKIDIRGFLRDVHIWSFVRFDVDASAIDSNGEGEVVAILTDSRRRSMACQVKNNLDGTYTCSYTPNTEGLHNLEVTYNDRKVPKGHLGVMVQPGSDPKRVVVSGPGVKDGPHLIAGEPTEFTVNMIGVGQGNLSLGIEGPHETELKGEDNKDGTCRVSYVPLQPGTYKVYVRYDNQDVSGSPFRVNVKTKLDVNKVVCHGPGLESAKVRAGIENYFIVDTKYAGEADLDVTYTPKAGAQPLPAIIQPLNLPADRLGSREAHQYKVFYTPEEHGPCQIDVMYGNDHVPGSPFTLQVSKAADPDAVHVHGPGIEPSVLASFPTSFTVDAREGGIGDLVLRVDSPTGQQIPIAYESMPTEDGQLAGSDEVCFSGLLKCTYRPIVAGQHKVNVMFADAHVKDSPFIVDATPTGHAELCEIKGPIKDCIGAGVEHCLTIDTSKGGEGQLTCEVVHSTSSDAAEGPVDQQLLDVHVEPSSSEPGITKVYYTPRDTGQLTVELRYGGQLIPKGHFVQKVSYRPVQFTIPASQGVKLQAVVISPSGEHKPVELHLDAEGAPTVTYQPEERGMHELHVKALQAPSPDSSTDASTYVPFEGSPYRFFVDSIGKGHVTAYGQGLIKGRTGQPAIFTVNIQDPTPGELGLSIEGPYKVAISTKEIADRVCEVSYTPQEPGDYNISVLYQERHVVGSPFTARIVGDPMRRAQLSLGASNNVLLGNTDEDISTLTGTVRAPSGIEEPCILKAHPDNKLGVVFTATEVGEHQVSVFQGAQHINGSPFVVDVLQETIGDAGLVKVSGPGLTSGSTSETNHFIIDPSKAGMANLSVSVTGPSHAEIETSESKQTGCIQVGYVVGEPGQYNIDVKYGDVHVPGSPFVSNIKGRTTMYVTEEVAERRSDAVMSSVDSTCEFSLTAPDTTLDGMSAVLVAPSGEQSACEIVAGKRDNYAIRFIPHMVGQHVIRVEYRGVKIAGSPYVFTVGPITDGRVGKVRAFGSGLQTGYTQQINEFNIYTHEAGDGILSIGLDGPSKAKLVCDELSGGCTHVSYSASVPGQYKCSVKFNDQHIPRSPFLIHVIDPTDTEQRTLYSIPFEHRVERVASESISAEQYAMISNKFSRRAGLTVHHHLSEFNALKAYVTSPSNVKSLASIESIAPDQYAVRFQPAEQGAHLVEVHEVAASEVNSASAARLGPAVDGSPFRLYVDAQGADPGMICASGDGLLHGVIGQKNTFFVNTVDAGAGVLSVSMEGPEKVAITTQEKEEGYLFIYEPRVIGVYETVIKYGGNFHIVGSPFQTIVTEPGQAKAIATTKTTMIEQSELTVKTSRKTMLNRHLAVKDSRQHAAFNARVDQIECRGLGLKTASMSHVNKFEVHANDADHSRLLVGITGPNKTCDKLTIERVRDSVYSVEYHVSEPGTHMVTIMWGDKHVPGSPFHVEVH